MKRGKYRAKERLNTIRMSVSVLVEEREDIEVLAKLTGYSMSASIAMAVKEMKERLEAGAANEQL